MQKVRWWTRLVAVGLLTVPTAGGWADEADWPRRDFQADLKGRNEVPLVLSAARGTLRLTISDDESSVHFVLSYTGLQAPVSVAHIHVGQRDVNGAVTVFFCGGGGRADCPQDGTVEGDFTAADVLGIPTQQLTPNDLPQLLKALRRGQTYANVHTMASPGGEIRGQIHVGKPRE
jgi:CHRD domain